MRSTQQQLVVLSTLFSTWLVGCTPGGTLFEVGDVTTGGGADPTAATALVTSLSQGSGEQGSSSASASQSSSGASTGAGTATDQACRPWTTGFDAFDPHAMVLGPDAQLLVAGDYLGSGRVLVLDACSGALLEDVELMAATASSTSLRSVLVAGDAIYLAGQATLTKGGVASYFAALNSVDLSPSFATLAFGLGATNQIRDLKLSANGSLWLAGTQDVGAGVLAPWLLMGNPDGSLCASIAIAEQVNPGTGRALATAADGSVHLLAAVASGPTVLRYDEVCGCDCAPEAVVPLNIGASELLNPNRLWLRSGQYYVAGSAPKGTPDGAARLAVFDSEGQELSAYVSASPNVPGQFNALVWHDELLYLAADHANDDNTADLGASVEVLAPTLPKPLGPARLVPLEELTLPDLDTLTGLVVQPGIDGPTVLVAGRAGVLGSIRRCASFGTC